MKFVVAILFIWMLIVWFSASGGAGEEAMAGPTEPSPIVGLGPSNARALPGVNRGLALGVTSAITSTFSGLSIHSISGPSFALRSPRVVGLSGVEIFFRKLSFSSTLLRNFVSKES